MKLVWLVTKSNMCYSARKGNNNSPLV